MPGFSFFYKLPNFRVKKKKSLICNSISGSNFQVNQFTIDKFIFDKVFIEKENVIFVLEGTILNKSELLCKYRTNSWSDLICLLYKRNIDFFKEFKGSFTGLVYNKNEDEIILFTDPLGTKHIYYYKSNSTLLVSSEIYDIYSYFIAENIEYSLSLEAAYNLLSYGYMLNNNTLCEEIKKISPGSYIKIKNGKLSIVQYYKLPLAARTINLSESEIIEKLDEKFRNAIKLQFDKDKEYGYTHFVALSGGLDSRMTSWVAHEMGYTNQLNFTFSQSNYLDETVPKNIASDLRHEWIFKALDNGTFLKDIDEINKITGGNVLYYGLAHGNSMMKLINFENIGIIHSGQLGDAIIGSLVKNLSQKSLYNLNGAYSQKLLLNKHNKEELIPEVIENILLNQRGLNGANNGLLISQNYSETISPFYDIDFFEFCLSIPIEFRMSHKLYKKWILTKYPKAANYVWESTKQKVSQKDFSILYKGQAIPIQKIFPIVLDKFRLRKTSIKTKNHMNPLDYWYLTNEEIKLFQDNYFYDNIDKIVDHKLRADCSRLYTEGSGIEKNQVLTLLSAYKLLFFSNHHLNICSSDI